MVRSETLPAKIIRLFTNAKYNHTSLALDDNLEEYYSFSRKHANSPFDGFVKEKASYYSLGKNKDIKIKIYRIPMEEGNLKKLLLI